MEKHWSITLPNPVRVNEKIYLPKLLEALDGTVSVWWTERNIRTGLSTDI